MDAMVWTALRAVQEQGGVRAAARALGQSPSAVSRRLKQAAEQYGFPLVRLAQDAGGRLVLTPGGEAVLRVASARDDEMQRTVQAFRRGHGRTEVQSVRLGAFASIQELCVIRAVKSIHAITPLRVHLAETAPVDAAAYIRQGRVDAAISLAEIPHDRDLDIRVEPLWRERFLLVVPVCFRELAYGREPLIALRRMPWVLPHMDSGCDRIVGRFLHRQGIHPRPISRTDDWSIMQQTAAELEAAALVPVSSFVSQAGLLAVSVGPAKLPTRTITLLGRSDVSWLATLRKEILVAAEGGAARFAGDFELLGQGRDEPLRGR